MEFLKSLSPLIKESLGVSWQQLIISNTRFGAVILEYFVKQQQKYCTFINTFFTKMHRTPKKWGSYLNMNAISVSNKELTEKSYAK